MIQDLRKEFSLSQVTETLEVSRSTYYAQVNQKKSQTQIDQENLEAQIKKEYYASKGRYGAPKIYQKLLKNGVKCSLKRVQRLMRKQGLQSIIRKKWKPKQSVKSERNHLPNLMKQDFTAEQLNQKWATDITYIHTLKDGWCYLSSIMDLCSKKIIAWDFSKRMESSLVLQTIDKVAYRANEGLILQTDQGSQYLSTAYEERLSELGIAHSYSQKGYPYDNSMIESFHAILKKEEVYQTVYPDFESAKQELFRYIEGWYNENRIHSRINYLTPNQVEQAA